MWRHYLSDAASMMTKEWRVLVREPVMIGLLVFEFVFAVLLAGSTHGTGVNNASVGIVDHDHSALTERITAVLRRPYFLPAKPVNALDVDAAMDEGRVTFILQFPPHFAADLVAGRRTTAELLVDATAMTQAFNGAGYIQNFVNDEIADYLMPRQTETRVGPDANFRIRFNPNMEDWKFTGVMELSQAITLIGIVLTGAAVLRERERGTLEHLLVLPVRSSAILLAKILANVAVILLCVALSLTLVVQYTLGIPVAGSVPLYLLGAGLYMFSVTAIGVFLSLAVRSTQEFGLLCLVTAMPMMILSGIMTPIESMPWFIRAVMFVLPSPHFVGFAADVVFRGADLSIVWPALLKLFLIGFVFTLGALSVFRIAMERANS